MISSQSAALDKLTESFREKILRKCGESVEMKERFFSKYADSLEAMSRALAARFQKGARLFAMGNGGSLCDGLHIAVEFNHPIIEKRVAFPVIPLMADTATRTAIGNDLEEARIPISEEVKGACEILGFDPLYVANEGKLLAIVPAAKTDRVLAAMRGHPLGQAAAVIGEVTLIIPAMS